MKINKQIEKMTLVEICEIVKDESESNAKRFDLF